MQAAVKHRERCLKSGGEYSCIQECLSMSCNNHCFKLFCGKDPLCLCFFFQIYIGMLNYLLFAFTQGIVAADGGV